MSLLNDFVGYMSNLSTALVEAGLVAEGEAHKIVAIKTGVLDQSIHLEGPEINGFIINVDLVASTDYAVFVHEGVKDQVYIYHRNKEAVYAGVGQLFFDRAIKEKEDEMFAIIQSTKIPT